MRVTPSVNIEDVIPRLCHFQELRDVPQMRPVVSLFLSIWKLKAAFLNSFVLLACIAPGGMKSL